MGSEQAAALEKAVERLPDANGRWSSPLRSPACASARFQNDEDAADTTLGRMHNATRRLKEWLDKPASLS